MKYTNAFDCAFALTGLDIIIYDYQRLTGEAFERNRPELTRTLRRRARLAEELAVHQAGPNGKMAHQTGTIRHAFQRRSRMDYRDYCATLPADDYFFNDVVMAVVGMSVRRHDVVHAALWRVNPQIAMQDTLAVVSDLAGLMLLKAELDGEQEPDIE